MRRPNASGGGMTGATGDITPDDDAEPFIPAELREISDPEHQADVTTAHGRGAPGQHGEIGHPGESNAGEGAPRSAIEPRPQADRAPDRAPRPLRAEDGDEFADHEEHF